MAEEKIIFEAIPMTLDEMKALKEAQMDTPFKTAALAVAAFCVYPKDRDESLKMLEFLTGPFRGMTISLQSLLPLR